MNYYKRSFAFVKSYIHDDMEAEDIVMEALIKLWSYLKEHPASFCEGLLLTMLKNKSLNYLKHLAVMEKVHERMMEDYADEIRFRIGVLESFDPNDVFSHEILDIYRRTMQGLPEQTRKIFEMSRFEHKTNKELAQELHISVKTVEYHISKALKVLRVHLKDYLPFLIFLLQN